MRYLVQLVIPAVILIGALYLAARSRSRDTPPQQSGNRRDSDQGTFVLILVVGALVAMGVIIATQRFWDAVP